MSTTIYLLLQKKDMFPPDSKIPAKITQCYGDGYQALRQILYESHPAFQVQPATLVMAYPQQRTRTLLEYYSDFIDFLQLRAIIKGHVASLDDADELDCFIVGTKYCDFLNTVTLEECQHASMLHKYSADQIVNTLMTWLRAPHSPMVQDEQAPETYVETEDNVGTVDDESPMSELSPDFQPGRV